MALGRLGVVLAARGRPGPVSLGPHGPHLVTTAADTKRVLTDTADFTFPVDVTRRAASGDHPPIPRLRPDQVATGLGTLDTELARAVRAWDDGAAADAMQVLRAPMARSTTDAVLGPVDPVQRDLVADLVLGWVDSLGPVISAARPPSRWSRTRRAERRARLALEDALAALHVERPSTRAVELAAGVQVPIAAGAWLLVLLGQHPEAPRDDPLGIAWEVLRLRPPTWITARMTTREVALEHGRLPAHAVVLVSPLLLGLDRAVLPPGTGDPEQFDPGRWSSPDVRPGAWLPFGAGVHACPGRGLGLAQLVALARWVGERRVLLAEDVAIDQSRGIFPSPARLRVPPTTEE